MKSKEEINDLLGELFMAEIKADKELTEMVRKLGKIVEKMGSRLLRAEGMIARLEKMKEIIEKAIAEWTEENQELRELYSEAYNLHFNMAVKNVVNIILSDEDLKRIQQGETLDLQYHNFSVSIRKENVKTS